MSQDSNGVTLPDVSRRTIMRAGAGLTALGLAGCQGLFGQGDQGVDPVQDRVTVNPDDIQEGGTFRGAIRENPDSFDYAYSSSAEATILTNLIYEGMITTDASGAIYDWLASDYETVEVQEQERADYEPYMQTVTAGEEGALPVDEQIVVTHPEDAGYEQGDEVRIMTISDAPAAVEDGTYGMHIRFDLHEGMTFHNGEEITAANVVASYGRIENSLLSAQVFNSLLHIESEGDYTVHLYAQVPDAAAVRELGGLPVYPTEMTDLPPEAMDPRQGNTPLGSGFFQFDDFENEEYFRFTTFDDHWFETGMKDWYDGPSDFPNGPVVDAVDVSIIPEDASRSAALQNDEIDMAYDLTASTLNEFQSSEDFRTATTAGAGFTFMQFPVNVPPFDDARVRRAVNHLVPREQIAQNIFDGWENPAWVPMPPIAAGEGTTDYDGLVEDLRSYNEYDPERASELAQQAIDENDLETPIEVTIMTNADNDDRVRTVELIVEALNQTDEFTAQIETASDLISFIFNTLYTPEFAENDKLAFIGLSGGFDPHGYANSVHNPANYLQCCNFQNVDIQAINEAIEEARFGTDVVEDTDLRRQRYDDLWELILEENANSYGTHSTTVSVLRDRVAGFNTYPSTQNIIGYGLYTPMDEQITYLDQG